MAKRKKYPKLPNGFGTIRYLGKGRRKPYAVHPPTSDLSKRQPALCYVNDWYTGFAILNAYKAGTYYDGMEKDIKLDSDDIGSINETINRILNDYSHLTQKIAGREDKELTVNYPLSKANGLPASSTSYTHWALTYYLHRR